MKSRQKKKLFKQLEKMEDFRRHREQIVYPQAEILFMSLLGLLKGCKNRSYSDTKTEYIRTPYRSTLGQ